MCWVRRRRMKGGRGWIIWHRCPWNLRQIWISRHKYKSLECLWPIWAAGDIVHSERQMWKIKSYLMSMTCQKQIRNERNLENIKTCMHKEKSTVSETASSFPCETSTVQGGDTLSQIQKQVWISKANSTVQNMMNYANLCLSVHRILNSANLC